jgi:hypothetical protein
VHRAARSPTQPHLRPVGVGRDLFEREEQPLHGYSARVALWRKPAAGYIRPDLVTPCLAPGDQWVVQPIGLEIKSWGDDRR